VVAEAQKGRLTQLRESWSEFRGTDRDDEIAEPVILEDPDQEAFLRQLDAIRHTLGRCVLVGIPTWLLLLFLYPLLVPGGALLVGFTLSTILAIGACVVFERWWRKRRRVRSGAAPAAPRPRRDPRTLALIGIGIGALVLVYVVFVIAVAR